MTVQHQSLSSPPRRQLRLLPAPGASGEPAVRGASAYRRVDRAFRWLDAAVERGIRPELNPFAQTGAIANTTFLIACVSGVLLLFWYETSVFRAHASVVAMEQAPLTAGLVRSVHRYSSDACMLFVLVHAVRLFAARRFTGARWVAWVTGVVSIGVLWLVGWLGYWLVWDERAHAVAAGTAKLLDQLPIFADPLSRAFVANETVNSLLFFVVFFAHMLLPLVMGIALWLHISRLSRPKFLTGKAMTGWVLASLLALSLLLPASAADAAEMTAHRGSFEMDWWYLAPIVVTDRLGGGALWALLLVSGAALLSVPWTLARGRHVAAKVEQKRCNACQRCVEDCPFRAIQMVPRTDGRAYPAVAEVDPDKCVSCGICVGSCNSAAIDLPSLPSLQQRKDLDEQIALARSEGRSPLVAFVCQNAPAAGLVGDAAGAALGQFHRVSVPCAGFINPMLIERALKRGAEGILIAACGPEACRHREGYKWTELRLSGAREPRLRIDRVDSDRVLLLSSPTPSRAALEREASRFLDRLREGRPRPKGARGGRGVQAWIAGSVCAALLSSLIWGITRVVYASPASDGPALVVSFKHPGTAGEHCRELTEEERASRPVHMRQTRMCDRRRSSVRLRVTVDDRVLLERAYEPGGVWNDGNSIALEQLRVPAGSHRVKVELGDTPDPSEWPLVSERRLRFEAQASRVVVFDKVSGFRWF